jgi:hypothetical protein
MEVIKMMITITPFTIDPIYNCPALPIGHEKEEHTERNYLPITYWGIYLNDKHISYTSSKELAEKTKDMDGEMAKGQTLKFKKVLENWQKFFFDFHIRIVLECNY